MELTRIEYRAADGVAWVTLNRPDVHNAFDEQMQAELASTWKALRHDEDVRVVVLTGAGEKAFCTGIDRSVTTYTYDPLTYDDPGQVLGPKSQGLWKPVIAAVNGMACGGAFYMLGEADVIIAADHATFFDPHVTYRMVAAFEPILLLPRMPFGEVLRMALTGTYERMSAERAMLAGFVSEVVPLAELHDAAQRLADTIAAQPPLAVQSTLRTLWAARDLTPKQATDLGNVFLQLGTSKEALEEGQTTFSSGKRIEPRIR
ncbi:MAG: enoyl-CoA hydratase/isomerase family protein [Actinobacteria bacterium]|nr:enoyl-CoA hydratase/isomerase family protein [Actinomycetota bacterium]MBV9252935.1 enoyl-CoA hydratase/isomerase family protein [Actinomycetota bacterium]